MSITIEASEYVNDGLDKEDIEPLCDRVVDQLITDPYTKIGDAIERAVQPFDGVNADILAPYLAKIIRDKVMDGQVEELKTTNGYDLVDEASMTLTRNELLINLESILHNAIALTSPEMQTMEIDRLSSDKVFDIIQDTVQSFGEGALKMSFHDVKMAVYDAISKASQEIESEMER